MSANSPIMAGAEKKIKTVTTVLWIALIGGAGLLIADKVLPLIARVLKTGINVGLLLIPASILLIMFTSPRFWTFWHFLLRSLGRMFVGWFQDIDPIGILETYVSDLKAKQRNIEKQIAVLGGVIHDIESNIESNKQKHDQSLALAGQARKQSDALQFQLQARRAGRLVQSNITQQQMLGKLTMVYKILKHIKGVSNFIIEDTEDQVNDMRKNKRAMDAAISALKSAWSIIKGGAAKEFADQTAARLLETTNQQMGQIMSFMDIAEEFVGSYDLQQGVYDESALLKLQEWESKSASMLLGNDTNSLLASGLPVMDPMAAALGQQMSGGRYANLIPIPASTTAASFAPPLSLPLDNEEQKGK